MMRGAERRARSGIPRGRSESDPRLTKSTPA
jgi:hypothetical protein